MVPEPGGKIRIQDTHGDVFADWNPDSERPKRRMRVSTPQSDRCRAPTPPLTIAMARRCRPTKADSSAPALRPNGAHQGSPGQRPGSPRPTPSRALKGRPTPHTKTHTRHPKTHDTDPPFQGFSSFQPPSPGRCPGLPWVAPLGLREQMTRISCQDRPRMDSAVDTISCQPGRTCRAAAPSPDESAAYRSLVFTT